MAPVPNGVYAVARPGELLLTLQGGLSQPGTPAVLLPPTGNPGEQEWQVERLENGNRTLRNLGAGTYLGFAGDPAPNKPIGGFPEPCEWALYEYESSRPRAFRVSVPRGPIDGTESVVGLSLLKIFPQRIALRPLDLNSPDQAWTLLHIPSP